MQVLDPYPNIVHPNNLGCGRSRAFDVHDDAVDRWSIKIVWSTTKEMRAFPGCSPPLTFADQKWDGTWVPLDAAPPSASSKASSISFTARAQRLDQMARRSQSSFGVESALLAIHSIQACISCKALPRSPNHSAMHRATVFSTDAQQFAFSESDRVGS